MEAPIANHLFFWENSSKTYKLKNTSSGEVTTLTYPIEVTTDSGNYVIEEDATLPTGWSETDIPSGTIVYHGILAASGIGVIDLRDMQRALFNWNLIGSTICINLETRKGVSCLVIYSESLTSPKFQDTEYGES